MLRTLCEAEQWDEAQTELQSLVDHRLLPRGGDTVWRMRIALGQREYQEVVRLARRSPRGNRAGQALHAMALAGLGESEMARPLGLDAVKKRCPGAEWGLGWICQQSGDMEGAVRWYERAARRYGPRAAVLRSMAHCLEELGDHEEAAWAMEKSIRSSPFIRPSDLRELAHYRERADQPRRAAEAGALAVAHEVSARTA